MISVLTSAEAMASRQNPSNTSLPTRLKRSDYPPNPAGASPRTAGFRYSLFSISPAERWGFFIDHLQRCIMDSIFDSSFSNLITEASIYDPWLALQSLFVDLDKASGDPAAQANYHAQIVNLQAQLGIH